ncbi:hypothetical protein ASF92_02290 [Pedobacter sp. Leaf176]|nr:hypothetical protein ASF92_02290 [Pedobacter sp. Leaf176]
MFSIYYYPRQRVLHDSSSGACAAENEALTDLSDIRSKPWVFLLLGQAKSKSPSAASEARTCV